MKLLLLTVGKPALAYAKAGRDEYLTRLAKFAPVEQATIRASDRSRESTALLARSEGYFRILLHEHGTQLTSRQLATKLAHWQQAARPLAIILGGADGHAPSLLERADFLWSLSPLTLQHELALVVTLEQLYRAHTILTRHPYHRD